MTTEECMAPVRWLHRGDVYPGQSGSRLVVLTSPPVLQQHWKVQTWLPPHVGRPDPVLLGTRYEWRDVPMVTEP